MKWAKRNEDTGFTIVELLVVIVVIGILAAITIVAFNGVRDKAVAVQIQAAVAQANKKILLYTVQNADMYPATLADADISETGTVKYQYTSDNTVVPHVYALTGSNDFNGPISYYLSSTQPKMTAGVAPGQNLAVWDKPNASSSPVSIVGGVAIDTAVYHSVTSSLRVAPGNVGKVFASSPVSGSVGQTYTVSLWIKSDAAWNGTGGNSKIRFGAASNGAWLKDCGYGGAKTAWTFVSCSYTLNASNTSVAITVGNDGSTGNIWLDDIAVSLQ